MSTETKHMKSIWYFVGLMLLCIGGLIFIAGIYLLISGTEMNTVLADLHPNIWWGGVMIIVGAIFLFSNKIGQP
jgi:hypothetical protein